MLGGVLALAASSLGQASFQGLGDLPGGAFASEANGVSADGLVVVGLGISVSGIEAFRWTAAGGMVGLSDLPGVPFVSFANGVSADGTVVVGRGVSTSGNEAFRWTSAGGMVGLGDLPGGIFSGAGATGLSADGSVVVGGSRSGGASSEAFRWTAVGGMVGLGHLPGGFFSQSTAFGISGDGAVIVGLSTFASENSGDFQAFRWTAAGGMVGLGDLPGISVRSTAFATSADGSVIVGRGFSAIGNEPFRWTTTEGMVGLGHLPGLSGGQASAVSTDGSVIVGSMMPVALPGAFVWTAVDGMRSIQDILVNDLGLDLTGWILEEATGVSADGQTIVGTGINPAGNDEAWIAFLDPTLFSIGLIDASDGALGGQVGTGLDVIGGMIYQDPLGGAGATDEPNQVLIGGFPTLEFDSYVTVDSGPVEPAPGYDGSDVGPASDIPGPPGFTTTSFRGAWFVPMFTKAFAAIKSGDATWEVFVGRITHTGMLSGRLATSITEVAVPGFRNIAGDIVTEAELATGQGIFTTDVNGLTLFNAAAGTGGYAWVAKQQPVAIGATMYTVSDIYLQFVLFPCPGDADGNNAVDLADLNLVLFNFGSAVAPGTNGDVDGDGFVGLQDLNLVLFNFGAVCP